MFLLNCIIIISILIHSYVIAQSDTKKIKINKLKEKVNLYKNMNKKKQKMK